MNVIEFPRIAEYPQAGADIVDGPVRSMTLVSLRLQRLRHRIDDPALNAIVTAALAETAEAVDAMRAIADHLDP